MTTQGYREEELVKNRAAVLLIGGGEGDRRAWADEVSTHFPDEGKVREVSEVAQLTQALTHGRGVVFIPDAVKLGYQGQAQVLRCLQYQEERPKIVVGLGMDPTQARSQGALREDLHYRLHLALVNLATPGLRDTLKTRRQKAEAERKEAAARAAALAKKGPQQRAIFRPARTRAPVVKSAPPPARAKPAATPATKSAPATKSPPVVKAAPARARSKPAPARPAKVQRRAVTSGKTTSAKAQPKKAKRK